MVILEALFQLKYGQLYGDLLVPAVDKFARFNDDGQMDDNGPVFYETSDCTGTPYLDMHMINQITVLDDMGNSKFFVIEGTEKVTKTIYCACVVSDCYSDPFGSVFENLMAAKEVELPFTLPVQPPLY